MKRTTQQHHQAAPIPVYIHSKIIALWKERVRKELPHLAFQNGMALTEAMPHLLDELEQTLLEASNHIPDPRSSNHWSEMSHKKIDLNSFGLGQVLHEYILLRRSIVEVFNSESPLSVQQVNLISDFILDRMRSAAVEVTHLQIEKERQNRIQTEQRIQTAYEHFRAAFDYASVGMAVLNCEGRFVEVNNAFCQMTGYSQTELSTLSALSLTTEEDAARSRHLIQKMIEGDFPAFEIEKTLIRKTGEALWVHNSVSSVRDPSGKIAHIVLVVQNITDQKRLEEERHYLLAISQMDLKKLREEREIREKFVNTLTHDLKTPLTAAKTNAELIVQFSTLVINDLKLSKESTVFKESNEAEKCRHLAKKLISSLDRIEHMIQDLLDANRIRAGQNLPIHAAKCKLSRILQEALDDLFSIYKHRLVLNSDQETEGFWDCNGIRRIVENLVSNAAKYGDPDTPITLTARRRGEYVVLSIHNWGKELTHEEQSRLFEPFQRATSALCSGKKGWGLGLTLVRGIAEAHGGKVSVKSSRDTGTTFVVELPIDVRHVQAS